MSTNLCTFYVCFIFLISNGAAAAEQGGAYLRLVVPEQGERRPRGPEPRPRSQAAHRHRAPSPALAQWSQGSDGSSAATRGSGVVATGRIWRLCAALVLAPKATRLTVAAPSRYSFPVDDASVRAFDDLLNLDAVEDSLVDDVMAAFAPPQPIDDPILVTQVDETECAATGFTAWLDAQGKVLESSLEKGMDPTGWCRRTGGQQPGGRQCCLGDSHCFKLVKNGAKRPTLLFRTKDKRVLETRAALQREVAKLNSEVAVPREGRTEQRLASFAAHDRAAALNRRQLWMSTWLEKRERYNPTPKPHALPPSTPHPSPRTIIINSQPRYATSRMADDAELWSVATDILSGAVVTGLVYRARHLSRLNTLGRPLCYVGLTRGIGLYLDEAGVVHALSYEYFLGRRKSGHIGKSRKEQRSLCFASHLGMEPESWTFEIVYPFGVQVQSVSQSAVALPPPGLTG